MVRREGQRDAHAGVWALSKNVPARLSCVVRVCPIARYARYVTDCQFSVSLQCSNLLRGVIVRLKREAVLESGDATLALKSCSHPPIVRERPGA